MFEKSQQEADIFAYIEDLGFHASHPEDGWTHKKKLYELMWMIQDELKTIPKFNDEEQWCDDRKKALNIK